MRFRGATDADAPVVAALVAQVLAEHRLRDAHDGDLQAIEAHYAARGGCFDLLVDDDDALLGCVGLYPLDVQRCELRRMYLAPAWRGRGFGRQLLEHALVRARTLGYTRMELETSTTMRAARALYERYGFQRLASARLASTCDRAYALDL